MSLIRLIAKFIRLKRYQYIPPTTTYSVAGTTVRFDTTDSYPNQHDFRDDITSEKPIIEDLLDHLRTDDIFYDIGANVGNYSCFVANHISSDQVIPFEPHPESAEKLRRNIELNNQKTAVQEVALSDESGSGSLTIVSPSGHNLVGVRGENTISVPVYRLDEYYQNENLPVPSVVKIDVEGAEKDVLEGFGEVIRSIRLLYCEIHSELLEENGSSHGEVMTYLGDHGFQIHQLGKRRENSFIRAKRDV